MRAVQISKTGGPEVLEIKEIILDKPGADEVTIEHKAIGLNYIDTYHRSGLYPLKLPSGLGIEGAGIIKEIVQIFITFGLVTVAWVFFRSENISSALSYLNSISFSFPTSHRFYIIYILLFIICDFLVMYISKHKNSLIIQNNIIRTAIYLTAVLLILFHMPNEASQFIYFQF